MRSHFFEGEPISSGQRRRNSSRPAAFDPCLHFADGNSIPCPVVGRQRPEFSLEHRFEGSPGDRHAGNSACLHHTSLELFAVPTPPPTSVGHSHHDSVHVSIRLLDAHDPPTHLREIQDGFAGRLLPNRLKHKIPDTPSRVLDLREPLAVIPTGLHPVPLTPS